MRKQIALLREKYDLHMEGGAIYVGWTIRIRRPIPEKTDL